MEGMAGAPSTSEPLLSIVMETEHNCCVADSQEQRIPQELYNCVKLFLCMDTVIIKLVKRISSGSLVMDPLRCRTKVATLVCFFNPKNAIQMFTNMNTI